MCGGGPQAPTIVYSGPSGDDIARNEAALAQYQNQMQEQQSKQKLLLDLEEIEEREKIQLRSNGLSLLNLEIALTLLLALVHCQKILFCKWSKSLFFSLKHS